jgi:hypothetical protein
VDLAPDTRVSGPLEIALVRCHPGSITLLAPAGQVSSVTTKMVGRPAHIGRITSSGAVQADFREASGARRERHARPHEKSGPQAAASDAYGPPTALPQLVGVA